MSVNLFFQPDAALANDGSSSLSGNYVSQRGRGQQQQQQVPQSGNRETADIIAASGEFGKKSRLNEYYNSQDQPFPNNAGTPNVRIRNQFNQSPAADKDNAERDNNRITQLGSREQQPPR